jgi:GNAT superfamily N-acetyltransferase
VCKELEFHKISADELSYVSYLCLWGVSQEQKEAMLPHMEERLHWIKEMMPKGLEIVVALGPRRSKRGLIEYVPIEIAPEPVEGQHSLFINCIWVLPRFLGAGLGTGLMECFLHDAAKVGGATVLSYENDAWFGYFEYMPTSFFKRFGLKELSRDGTRVLLHRDLGAQNRPQLISAKKRELETNGQTIVDVFCSSQCPWCGWMADKICSNAPPGMRVNRIGTDSRTIIKKFGLSRGVSINGEPAVKRMAAWREIQPILDRTRSGKR